MTILIPLVLGLVAFAVFEARRAPASRPDAQMEHSVVRARLVFALGRFNARLLWRSRLVWVGGLLTAWGIFAVGSATVPNLAVEEDTITLFFFPLAGMVLLATNLAALRSRLDGTEELLASLPTGRDVRTMGDYASLTAAAGVALVALTGFMSYLYLWSKAIGRPEVADVLTGPLLVVCAGVVGIAAARIIPSAIGGLIALFAMGMMQGMLDHFTGLQHLPQSWFAFLVIRPEFWPSDLLVRRTVPHLIYLVGLGAFAAVLGLMRHRRDRTMVVALVAAISVAAVGGVAQALPRPEGEYRRIAQWIAEPQSHQTCERQGLATVCAYQNYTALTPSVLPVAARVAAAAPDAQPFTLRMRSTARDLYELPDEVKRLLPDGIPTEPGDSWPQSDDVPIRFKWCRDQSCALSLGVLVGAHLVGLPLTPSGGGYPDPEDLWSDVAFPRYDSSGQARAVVALWLGTNASPRASAFLAERLDRRIPGEDRPILEPRPVEGCEGVSESGTNYAPADAQRAVQLAALPQEQVRATIAANWDLLVNPRTKTDAVVDLFELPALGPMLGGVQAC